MFSSLSFLSTQMQFMLLFSRQGKLRLQKWYVPLSDKEKKKITRELVQTVLARKPKMCSFLEWRDLKIVYKRSVSAQWSVQSWQVSPGNLQFMLGQFLPVSIASTPGCYLHFYECSPETLWKSKSYICKSSAIVLLCLSCDFANYYFSFAFQFVSLQIAMRQFVANILYQFHPLGSLELFTCLHVLSSLKLPSWPRPSTLWNLPTWLHPFSFLEPEPESLALSNYPLDSTHSPLWSCPPDHTHFF